MRCRSIPRMVQRIAVGSGDVDVLRRRPRHVRLHRQRHHADQVDHAARCSARCRRARGARSPISRWPPTTRTCGGRRRRGRNRAGASISRTRATRSSPPGSRSTSTARRMPMSATLTKIGPGVYSGSADPDVRAGVQCGAVQSGRGDANGGGHGDGDLHQRQCGDVLLHGHDGRQVDHAGPRRSRGSCSAARAPPASDAGACAALDAGSGEQQRGDDAATFRREDIERAARGRRVHHLEADARVGQRAREARVREADRRARRRTARPRASTRAAARNRLRRARRIRPAPSRWRSSPASARDSRGNRSRRCAPSPVRGR